MNKEIIKKENNISEKINLELSNQNSDIKSILSSIFKSKKKRKDFFNKLNKSKIEFILSFLHISDIQTIKLLARKFNKVLKRNDFNLLRLIGNHSYGLFNTLDFLNDPNNNYTIKTIRSNNYPMIVADIIKDHNILVVSPSGYKDEISYWNLNNKLYVDNINIGNILNDINIEEITLNLLSNNDNLKYYVNTIKYMSQSNMLVVGFDKGLIVGYKYNDFKQTFICKWKSILSDEENTLKFMDYLESKDILITIESITSIKVNFLKTWSSNGIINKKAIYLDEVFTAITSFEQTIDNIVTQIIAIGTENGNVLLLKYDDIDNEFNHLIIYKKLKVPVTEVDKILYLKSIKILVVCFRLIGIYIYNMNPLDINNYCDFINRYINGYHIDEVNDIILLKEENTNGLLNSNTVINNSYIATCSTDRQIICWSINNSDYNIVKLINYNHSKPLYKIFFNKNIKELIGLGADKTALALTINDQYTQVERVNFINGHSSAISCYQLDFLNKKLITSSTDKTIKIWNYDNLALEKTILINEYADNFILLFDRYNTIVKLDTKGIQFIRETPTNNSCIKINTIEEAKESTLNATKKSILKPKCILNFMDGISFAVGYEDNTIIVYYYVLNKEENSYIVNKKHTLKCSPEGIQNSIHIQDVSNLKESISKDCLSSYVKNEDNCETINFENNEKLIGFEIDDILTNIAMSNINKQDYLRYFSKIEKDSKSIKEGKISKLLLIHYNKKRKYLFVGSSTGGFAIFNLKQFNCVYYNELPDKSCEIIDICPFEISNECWRIGLLTKQGDLYKINLTQDYCFKKVQDRSKISSIDRLNNKYYILGYIEFNRVEVMNSENDCEQVINVSHKNPKPLIYLRDSNRILSYSGSASTSYCFDLIQFNF